MHAKTNAALLFLAAGVGACAPDDEPPLAGATTSDSVGARAKARLRSALSVDATIGPKLTGKVVAMAFR